MFPIHNQRWKAFLSNSKTTFIWRAFKASKMDVSESVGVWQHFFFSSGGTKPNKEIFLGRAYGYLQALHQSQDPSSIKKVNLRAGLILHWGEVRGSLFSVLSSVSLWGAGSKMTSYNSEKYITSHFMFTMFMINYLKYTDQEMQDLKKNPKTNIGFLECWNSRR